MSDKINTLKLPQKLYSHGGSLLFYLLLTGTAWAYIWMRATLIPFQSDEAATFFMYVQTGNFLPPNSTPDANNHILNSFLTWIFYKVFGPAPIALRLPNVLSALLYFYFVYRLSRKINWIFARWGFITLAIGTHFLLEFFSYSRGYGLSLALLVGVAYNLILVSENIRLKTVIRATLLTMLATAANLNLIFISLSVYFYLLFLLLFTLKTRKKRTAWAGILFLVLAGGISTFYLTCFSFQIRQVHGFYYGASTGFFQVTIRSLATMISGRWHFITEIFAITAIVIAVLVNTIVLLFKKLSINNVYRHSVFLGLLLVSWLSALLLNRFMHVNYQEDRAAMHLIPIFYGMVMFGLDSIYPILKRFTVITLAPLIFILLFSIRQVDLVRTVYGNSQQVPSEFFEYIQEENVRKGNPPVVSSYQARRQVWAFMNYSSGGLLNPLTGKDFPDQSADFLIHQLPLKDSLNNFFTPVLEDKITGTGLYMNVALPDYSIFRSFKIDTPIYVNDLYNNLFQANADSLIGKSLRLETDLTVESDAKPLRAVIVAEIFDIDHKSISYEAVDLDQLRPSWNRQNQHFRHVMNFQKVPQNSKLVRLYLWNKDKVPVKISTGQINLRLSKNIM